MMKPTIHLNGTSKKELLDQSLLVVEKIRDAMEALAKATPNGRDYYVQGPNAIKTALEEHNARATKLQEVLDDMNELVMHIVDSE